MVKAYRFIQLLILCYYFTACSVVRQVEQLPVDTYSVPAAIFLSNGAKIPSEKKSVKATLKLADSILYVHPIDTGLTALHLNLQEPRDFRFYRRTFDVDVLTIPFKVRPSVQGFPEQLNPNFSAALYLGRRFDFYHIKPKQTINSSNSISGFGGGYGGFIGLGSTTMNPYVTHNAITYEYEGFVLTTGVAGIYDAKKFNLGLALGFDFLVDKNRRHWLYQHKPWVGLLFGINLN